MRCRGSGLSCPPGSRRRRLRRRRCGCWARRVSRCARAASGWTWTGPAGTGPDNASGRLDGRHRHVRRAGALPAGAGRVRPAGARGAAGPVGLPHAVPRLGGTRAGQPPGRRAAVGAAAAGRQPGRRGRRRARRRLRPARAGPARLGRADQADRADRAPAVTVAVLGTGIMGSGMARSLLRAGHEVRVWNRTADRAKPLAEDGATVAADASEAVRGADVVLTMLFDADSVLQVVGAVVDQIGPDAVWLQTSTIGVDGAERAAAFAAEHGIAALDAPVLGTKAPAEQGTLTVLVSGDPALVDRVRPVLDAIGAKTVVAGDRFGQASALKLACNSFIAVVTAA